MNPPVSAIGEVVSEVVSEVGGTGAPKVTTNKLQVPALAPPPVTAVI